MPNIFITPAAEDDLINIWIYIARDNPKAADRTFQAAEATFELLAEMPSIGVSYWTTHPKLKDVKFFPVKNFSDYIVYYRELTECIEIVRVLHARMKKNLWLEN
ncbi:type II toxin-antitoxin system RelE/ParE family toxin [Desulfobacter sp.]|uniref:type II toxin-antitoxin system RelE/ParE family toxin n=1 Tax=Desulfobacter sp. TaxID=2294 RepID=UPI003D12CC5A